MANGVGSQYPSHRFTPSYTRWSVLHTTSEFSVPTITTADAHTSAASSRLNWRPRRFKWTRPFRRKTKSGFCACAITFQTQSTYIFVNTELIPLMLSCLSEGQYCSNHWKTNAGVCTVVYSCVLRYEYWLRRTVLRGQAGQMTLLL